MALVKAKKIADDRPITYDNEVAAKIQQRRYQVLIHSLLYYDCDVTVVSDRQWQEWAQELVKLQTDNPEIAEQVIFADAFRNFDASSGFDLPYRDGQIVRAAIRLIQYNISRGNSQELQEALHKLQYQTARLPEEWDSYKKKKHSLALAETKKEVKKVEQKQPRKGLFSVPGA